MRIVGLIGSVAPSFGGPAVGSARLNEALNEAGFEAVLLSTDLGLERDEISRTGHTDLGSSRLRLEVYRSNFPSSAENSWKLWIRVFWLSKDADVIHLHGLHRGANIAGYAAARFWQKPYGVQPHGVLEPFTRTTSAGRKRLFDIVIGQKMVRRAAYVLFASESEAARAADLVSSPQVFIHPLGATLPPGDSRLNGPVGDAIESAGRARNVCFMGRFASKKQPLLLVRAWSKVVCNTSANLIFAGPDGDLRASDILALATELGVRDSVHVVGTVAGPSKSWLLKRCSIFVLPSLNENFGITIAEAMLAGMNVITTSEVAAGEHVRRAGAGTVLKDPDADDLADAIEVALNDPVGSCSAGDRGRSYAEQHLTWISLANALRERLQSFLN